MNSQKLSPAKQTSNVTGRGSDRQKATRFMFERYRDILDAVRSSCYPNTSQLARKLEVSMSTVSRDIEFLRERLGCPIEYDFYRKGYHCSESFQLAF